MTNAMDALKKEGVECMVAPYGKLASSYPPLPLLCLRCPPPLPTKKGS